jgi:Pectate lyase superfamily protein
MSKSPPSGSASRLWLALAIGACSCRQLAAAGADMPWVTYEAEAMKGTGVTLGPKYDPNLVESESSGEQCVKLTAAGEFLEFTAKAAANSMVVRYSLPDSAGGGGTDTTLELLINGKRARDLPLTSRYSHLYGAYPFSNQPDKGKPRNFYDELRVKDLTIAAGDVIRLQRLAADTEYCILDLVDLEDVPAALPAPDNSLNLVDFGGDPRGGADSTEALRRCIAAAQGQGKAVWVPTGDYKVTGEILLPSSVTIQGAGMWHTTFVGDAALYGDASRRVRFKLKGSHIHLADFAILGRLNYRDDSEPNDGIIGAGCAESTVSRIWLEHTKVGIWIYNGVNLTIEGCRFRDTIADGVNLCVGTSGTVIENCTARGTGDDCFAIWPAPSDQGFLDNGPRTGNNAIRRCTGQLPFLANGAAVYGGASNSVEDCLFTDITTGCGILVSTTFPTSDEKLGIDNNFSGTTRVTDCELVRCGGYDHDWAWRGSVQICMDRRSISGLVVNGLLVKDSFSSGITVVAPGSAKGNGTLTGTKLENVRITNSGIGSSPHHDLWIGKGALGGIDVVDSSIGDVLSESEAFKITILNP